MEWAGIAPVPVVLNAQRPGRNRPRHASDFHSHQQWYVQDGNGLLVPAANFGGGGLHRSNSAAGQRPAAIIINNTQYDDYSPERSLRRRSHGPHYGSDSWDERSERSHSHERHRPRSRSGHHGRRHSPSRTPSPDPEMERRLHRLADLERKEGEDAARQRFEEQRILDEAKKAKKKKEEEALLKRAVEEYNAKKLEEELKKKKEKEEADKAFKERVRMEFGAAGYDEASIEKILEKEGKGKSHGQKKIMDLTRPTYIKVHRRHLSPDTLDLYDLPWEWDDVSSLFECHCKVLMTDPGVAQFELYHHQALDTRA